MFPNYGESSVGSRLISKIKRQIANPRAEPILALSASIVGHSHPRDHFLETR